MEAIRGSVADYVKAVEFAVEKGEQGFFSSLEFDGSFGCLKMASFVF